MSPSAHELRNEVVEELMPGRINTSRGEQAAQLVRGGRNSGMESKQGRRWEKWRDSQEKKERRAPLGEACLSEKGESNGWQNSGKPEPSRARWQSRMSHRTA